MLVFEHDARVQSRCRSTFVRRRQYRQHTATYDHRITRSPSTLVASCVAVACVPPVVSSCACWICPPPPTRTRLTPPVVRRPLPTWCAWRRPRARSVVATAAVWNQIVCRRRLILGALTPSSSSSLTEDDVLAAFGSPTPVSHRFIISFLCLQPFSSALCPASQLLASPHGLPVPA